MWVTAIGKVGPGRGGRWCSCCYSRWERDLIVAQSLKVVTNAGTIFILTLQTGYRGFASEMADGCCEGYDSMKKSDLQAQALLRIHNAQE